VLILGRRSSSVPVQEVGTTGVDDGRDIKRVGRLGVRIENGRDDGSLEVLVLVTCLRGSEGTYFGRERCSGEDRDFDMRGVETLDRERRHWVENIAD
jgi:hypothetical protein